MNVASFKPQTRNNEKDGKNDAKTANLLKCVEKETKELEYIKTHQKSGGH